jgi:RimJ/RimL family protein N-acetyltransferase
MHLETERLILRGLQPSDIPALVQLWSDPDVTRFMGGPRDKDWLRDAFEGDLRNPSPSTYDDPWPVIEKPSSRLVGHCGLLAKDIDDQPEIELVYVFAKPAWGKGYATEVALALKEYAQGCLDLHRLVALVDPQNAASARVAEKAGLCFERKVVRPDGKVMLLHTVSLT